MGGIIFSFFVTDLTLYLLLLGAHHGRDCIVVGFTTNVVSSNLAHGKVYWIQHYVIKFVSDLQQVSGFLRVLWFPPPIELTATI